MNLLLKADFNPTGVGTFAQYLANALILEFGDEIQLQHLGRNENLRLCMGTEADDRLGECLLRSTSPRIPDWEVHVVLPYNLSPSPSARVAMFSFFETSKPTKDFVDGVTKSNITIVPTTWHRDRLRMALANKPLGVVPGGVSDLLPIQEPKPVLDALRICHIGKWEVRKDQTSLLLALRIAGQQLPRGKEIFLNTFWDNPWDPEGYSRALRMLGFRKRQQPCLDPLEVWNSTNVTVQLHKRVPTQREVLEHMALAHMAIYPTRGEGWGLPMWDSIGLGIPTMVPAARWTNDMGQMVPKVGTCWMYSLATEPTPAEDGVFFNRLEHGQWETCIDIDRIVGLILQGFQPSFSSLQKAFYDNAAHVRNKFSWANSARELIRVLGEVKC